MKASLANSRSPQRPVAAWLASVWLGLSLAPVLVGASGDFSFRELEGGRLELREGDQPVLVYNHGVQLPPDVPADRARSSYVHPLYGLDGEVLTDDFPRDHYHHRGVFWAWPHVTVDGREYDLWAIKGLRHRFLGWLEKTAEPNRAMLAVTNGWFIGERKVMAERVKLTVHPARADTRAIDLDFTWTPVGSAVTLRGAPGKSYGGLTLRVAPGTNTVITVPTGVTRRDLTVTRLPWADLTRTWTAGGRTSGVALFVAPDHPDFPPEWLTRHYGALCIGWPGVQAQTFPSGQPIHCRYRLWIHRGQVDKERLQSAWDSLAEDRSRGWIRTRKVPANRPTNPARRSEQR